MRIARMIIVAENGGQLFCSPHGDLICAQPRDKLRYTYDIQTQKHARNSSTSAHENTDRSSKRREYTREHWTTRE